MDCKVRHEEITLAGRVGETGIFHITEHLAEQSEVKTGGSVIEDDKTAVAADDSDEDQCKTDHRDISYAPVDLKADIRYVGEVQDPAEQGAQCERVEVVAPDRRYGSKVDHAGRDHKNADKLCIREKIDDDPKNDHYPCEKDYIDVLYESFGHEIRTARGKKSQRCQEPGKDKIIYPWFAEEISHYCPFVSVNKLQM